MLKISPNIKLIVTDFDGVITDGFVYLSSNSLEEQKRVSFKDIMGMSLAVKNGYKIAIISGEKNQIIDIIARKFNLTEVHQGIRNKLKVLEYIASKYNLSMDEIVYIGDDINDIPCLNAVGTPVTVPEANYKVKQINNIQITTAKAGDGAFREVVDSLLEVTSNQLCY